VTGTNAEVYITDTNGISGSTVETSDGVGHNRAKVFEIQSLRGDVNRGTRIQNKGKIGPESNKGATGFGLNRTGHRIRGSGRAVVLIPINGYFSRFTECNPRVEGIGWSSPCSLIIGISKFNSGRLRKGKAGSGRLHRWSEHVSGVANNDHVRC